MDLKKAKINDEMTHQAVAWTVKRKSEYEISSAQNF